MFLWKRKVQDKMVIGDEIVVVVSSVNPAGGGVFKGTVSLGFEVPEGVLVQRAETYVKQEGPQPSPQFYRVVNKENGNVFGYSFTTASEGSTLSYGYNHELISGYADMTEDDHLIHVYLFRSEAEAEACVLGVTASGEVGLSVGVVKERIDKMWAVFFDFYDTTPDDVNPVIRSFANPSPRVTDAIESGPRRKSA